MGQSCLFRVLLISSLLLLIFFSTGVALKDGETFEYVITYEDKDRDWMLIGDVPWQMFKESCKRLRIVKRSDATGFGLQRYSSLGDQ